MDSYVCPRCGAPVNSNASYCPRCLVSFDSNCYPKRVASSSLNSSKDGEIITKNGKTYKRVKYYQNIEENNPKLKIILMVAFIVGVIWMLLGCIEYFKFAGEMKQSGNSIIYHDPKTANLCFSIATLFNMLAVICIVGLIASVIFAFLTISDILTHHQSIACYYLIYAVVLFFVMLAEFKLADYVGGSDISTYAVVALISFLTAAICSITNFVGSNNYSKGSLIFSIVLSGLLSLSGTISLFSSFSVTTLFELACGILILISSIMALSGPFIARVPAYKDVLCVEPKKFNNLVNKDEFDTINEKMKLTSLNEADPKPLTRENSQVDNNEPNKSDIELLKQLKELYDSGVITKEEFDNKKEEILKRI